MLSKETQQLYWVYHDAKQRCTNPKHRRFARYGGRGIQFKFTSFESWLNYMGPRPVGYELDRINNDGHYEMGNVRWATQSIQQKNKNIYSNNSSGITGVSYVFTLEKWIVHCNNSENGKRDYLYVGKDFFEACCARRSWESNQSAFKIRNRRGKSFERDASQVAV